MFREIFKLCAIFSCMQSRGTLNNNRRGNACLVAVTQKVELGCHLILHSTLQKGQPLATVLVCVIRSTVAWTHFKRSTLGIFFQSYMQETSVSGLETRKNLGWISEMSLNARLLRSARCRKLSRMGGDDNRIFLSQLSTQRGHGACSLFIKTFKDPFSGKNYDVIKFIKVYKPLYTEIRIKLRGQKGIHLSRIACATFLNIVRVCQLSKFTLSVEFCLEYVCMYVVSQ